VPLSRDRDYFRCETCQETRQDVAENGTLGASSVVFDAADADDHVLETRTGSRSTDVPAG
jgi:hypothetical protein